MNPRQSLAFLEELRKAPAFEDAALIMLREMLATARTALGASRYAKRGRILRAMAHLRPGDGYRRLVSVEEDPQKEGPSISYAPSASAWRWVAQHQCPVSVDVATECVRKWSAEGAQVVHERAFSTAESLARLASREVSHLYGVPLRSFRGTVEGMATVEVECRAIPGQDPLFAELAEPMALLAELATPYLAVLPMRPSAPGQTDELLPVIGQSMAGTVQMLRVFAQQEETLLLGGPTGAGKSRLARFCHEQSSRRGKAFEVLDLLTVPEELQMAELFGWRKGAFTGAVRDAPGAMARAAKGTLFIDEIDKLSLKAQAGLLHLLEARTYRPLGDAGRELHADVRFVIGSNLDLFELVKSGKFREDLYYRINVLPVKIPPLDDRRDEIPQWVRFMALRRHRESSPEGEVRVAAGAERLLAEHGWPGNLRQLDNVVRRAYAMALMTHGGASPEVLLEERHFSRSLSYERGSARRSALESIRNAAQAFVEEAERLEGQGQVLDLDLADAFRGIVLGTAVQRQGGRDVAFRLLGKGAQVQSRNHHKMLRRELEKVDALCRALGEEEGKLFPGLRDEEG